MLLNQRHSWFESITKNSWHSVKKHSQQWLMNQIGKCGKWKVNALLKWGLSTYKLSINVQLVEVTDVIIINIVILFAKCVYHLKTFFFIYFEANDEELFFIFFFPDWVSFHVGVHLLEDMQLYVRRVGHCLVGPTTECHFIAQHTVSTTTKVLKKKLQRNCHEIFFWALD